MTTPTLLLRQIRALNDSERTLATRIRRVWLQFGRSIRRARKDRGIPLRVIAAHLRVTTAYFAMLETGKRGWSMRLAVKATAFVCRKRPEYWPDSAGGRHHG